MSADNFIPLGKKIKICSGALVGGEDGGWNVAGERYPLHHYRLLAALDSVDSADGSPALTWAVLVLTPDAAKGGPGILVDGGPPQEVASLLWATTPPWPLCCLSPAPLPPSCSE